MQNNENIVYKAEYDSMCNEYLRLQKDMRLANDIISEVQDENNKFEQEISLLKKQRDLLAEKFGDIQPPCDFEYGYEKMCEQRDTHEPFGCKKRRQSKTCWLQWSENKAMEDENG